MNKSREWLLQNQDSGYLWGTSSGEGIHQGLPGTIFYYLSVSLNATVYMFYYPLYGIYT